MCVSVFADCQKFSGDSFSHLALIKSGPVFKIQLTILIKRGICSLLIRVFFLLFVAYGPALLQYQHAAVNPAPLIFVLMMFHVFTFVNNHTCLS